MDRWPIEDEAPVGDGTDIPDSAFITGAAVAPDVVSLSGSNIVFHNTYGSGVTAAFHQSVLDAEHAIQNKLTAGSTVDLYASFNFASLGPSFSGQNNFFLYNETYAAWRAQVAARATSPDDALAVAALPSTDPTGGLGVYLPSGYARMMGMSVGNDVDAIVLNSDLTFNFTDGDAAGVLEHELTEGAMGRISSLGFRSFGSGTHFWNPMDFFRFAASGARDYTGGKDGVATYFGFDATHVFTAFQYHNSINAAGQYDGFDLADWDHTVGDAFGPGGPGSPGVMSAADLQVMDVLGWSPVAGPPGAIAISDVSISEGNSGTKTAIFTVTRTGGTSAFAVNFATADGSATVADNDYVAASGTLSFGAGVNSQTISVTINSDTKIEFDETFLVNLSGATNGATISDSQAVGTIANDDNEYASPASVSSAFGTLYSAGGWVSNDLFPRELADVNHDGMADIVGFGDLGVFVSLATGGGSFAAPTFKLNAFGHNAGGWSSEDTFPRHLADVNGDGMADIVGFGGIGVYVSLATGGGSFGPSTFKLNAFGPSAGGWISDDRYPRELGDVDGDGLADIVGFGDLGVYVSLATGGGSFAAPTFKLNAFGPSAGGWASNSLFPRMLADLNGDHMADIVGFGDLGVFVSLATGGGSFAAPTFNLNAFGHNAGGWVSEDRYPRELADVDGDGKIDIVGFGDATVFVAYGNGDGSFKPVTTDLGAFTLSSGGWSSDNVFPRHLADINHDGAADIVGFGIAGVQEALSHAFHIV